MSQGRPRIIVLACFCALAAGALTVTVAAAAAPRTVRLGSGPRRPSGSRVVGPLPASTAISVTVALKPRDPAALEAYATAVSTPGSSVYRQYLSVAQFRERFAPTGAQVAAVESSLRRHGLRPGTVTANGLAIPVRATSAALARAFSTSFDRVSVHGRSAFANTQAPLLDSSIAELVQGVIGLNNLAVPRPLALRAREGRAHAVRHVATGGPQPCSTATSAAPGQSAYTSDQIASAYNFSGLYGASDDGSGETVAIFELENNFPSDITAFESCYGITTGTVSYTHVDGGPGKASAANGDGIETELDIENVLGLAPQANVHVFQGPYYTNATDTNIYDIFNAMITSGAQVLSTSWGLCEPDSDPSLISSENTLFQEAATHGQSVFAAAGDSGSEDCGDGDNALAVDDPASQPYVTGAGGTSLTSLGPPPAESVWNDECGDGPCGGGGGISTLWAMPSYQSGAPASLNVISSDSSGAPCGASSGSCREVPDVSADADPNTGYLIYWDGNGTAGDSSAWIGIGGTSGAAPLWAALTADTNSACSGSPVGFANPKLYSAAGNAYAADFNDVTSGENALSGSGESLYSAGSGYDMASGLGTPNAYRLASMLCGDVVQITNPGSQRDHVSQSSESAQLQINATDSDGQTLSYSAQGLPPGLSIDPSSGLISGDPTTSGSYSVTVTASDQLGSSAQITFTWTIITPVSLTDPGPQASVTGETANLQLSGSDSDSQTLSYSATGLPAGLSVDATTGEIVGQPTTPGTYTVTATASDPTPYSDSVQFSWTVDPVTVAVSPPGNQAGIVGVATSLQANASDNNGGALTYSATGLPSGLSINGTNGLIGGTPSAAGTYTVTLTATDGSASGSTTFTWTITTGTVAVANPGTQRGRVGEAARLQIFAADNNAGALSYSAGGLPRGLSIDASKGLITGTPTSGGSSTVTVTARDGTYSTSTSFNWTIGGLPSSSDGSLKGVARRRPKLSVKLTAGLDAPDIATVVLSLPRGLRLHRTAGIALTGSNGKRLKGYRLKLSGGKLTIALRSAVPTLRITVGQPALAVSSGLVTNIKRGAAPTLTLGVTDTSGFNTPLLLKLRPS